MFMHMSRLRKFVRSYVGQKCFFSFLFLNTMIDKEWPGDTKRKGGGEEEGEVAAKHAK